jgi:hypothetical protein
VVSDPRLLEESKIAVEEGTAMEIKIEFVKYRKRLRDPDSGDQMKLLYW